MAPYARANAIICAAFIVARGGKASYLCRMKDQSDWEAQVKNLLKAELKKRGVTYAQLVDKLAEIGVSETEPNIRNKLARGKFTAVFLVQCLTAIGSTTFALD